MTRIVLLLTAIPLAAVLALLLNTLLDRRLAALEPSSRRAARPVLRRGLPLVLVLALGAVAMPATAEDAAPPCGSIDCSLLVEATRVDRLWRNASSDRVGLVAQSRIPVVFDPALDRWDADREDVIATDQATDQEAGSRPAPPVEPNASRP